MEIKTKNKPTTKAPELFITDKRMLELISFLKYNPIKGVTTAVAFCEVLGIHKSVIAAVKGNVRGFTAAQLLTASDYFGISINWLFGKTNQMFSSDSPKTPLAMLKEAVAAIENSTVVETKTSKAKAVIIKTKNRV